MTVLSKWVRKKKQASLLPNPFASYFVELDYVCTSCLVIGWCNKPISDSDIYFVFFELLDQKTRETKKIPSLGDVYKINIYNVMTWVTWCHEKVTTSSQAWLKTVLGFFRKNTGVFDANWYGLAQTRYIKWYKLMNCCHCCEYPIWRLRLRIKWLSTSKISYIRLQTTQTHNCET